MRITKITIDGKKIGETNMQALAKVLREKIQEAGFITDVDVVNSSCIKLGLHMKSFIIDTKVHGYNTRHNPYSNPRRTSVPSWNQRVEYNNIVNKCLDKYNISANIKSGCFTIRQGVNSMNESDWHNQVPDWMHHNEMRGWYLEEGFDEDAAKERKRQARKERKLKLAI